MVEAAKKHFNCPTLKGVELENQGGSGTDGSHWEERIMAGDFMIGEDLDEYVISPMSLALMEDSGWYQVNYFHAGLFRFGKNQGCGFVDGKCITNEKSTFSNEYLVNQLNSLCFAGRSAKGGSSLIIVEEDKENQEE